jgi:uncharacterized protein YdhG (YjbR/CyaY superfamily)
MCHDGAGAAAAAVAPPSTSRPATPAANFKTLPDIVRLQSIGLARSETSAGEDAEQGPIGQDRWSRFGHDRTRPPPPTTKGSLLPRLIDQQNEAMSAQEIDQYLAALDEPKRTTLARLRQTILDILPEVDQGISYGLPAFKVRGKTIAGFAAFKNHLSYLPHSGSVFPQLQEELKGYATSSGALRFSIDEPLPAPLVQKLIAVRLQEAFPMPEV